MSVASQLQGEVPSPSGLEQLLGGPGTDRGVLAVFTATWCGPCRQQRPVLEQLAGRYADRLDLVFVDSDTEPGLTRECAVHDLPTALLYAPAPAGAGESAPRRPGDPTVRVTGARPRAEWVAAIEEVLAHD